MTNMVIRAKFRLDEQTNRGQGKKDGKSIIKTDYVFRAVADDSPENKAFWEWTPFGEIKLSCINPEVLKELDIGTEFYIDFTPIKPQS